MLSLWKVGFVCAKGQIIKPESCRSLGRHINLPWDLKPMQHTTKISTIQTFPSHAYCPDSVLALEPTLNDTTIREWRTKTDENRS